MGPQAGFASTFGGYVSDDGGDLPAGGAYYLGDNTQGLNQGAVAGRLVGTAQSVSSITANSNLLVEGQFLVFTLYLSTDQGATFNPVANAVINSGQRQVTASFGAVALPPGSLHLFSVVPLGVAYQGVVSAVAF